MPLTRILELHTPPVVYSIILLVGYTNSVVNPFIYGFFIREFRQVIIGGLRRMGLLVNGWTGNSNVPELTLFCSECTYE